MLDLKVRKRLIGAGIHSTSEVVVCLSKGVKILLMELAMNRTAMIRRVASLYMKANLKPTKVLFVEAVVDNPKDILGWYENLRAREAGGKTRPLPDISEWKKIAHHMTFEFLGGKGNAESLVPYGSVMGKEFALKIVGVAYDDTCVAVVVEPPSQLRGLVKNKHPHITLAVNGVQASYSNTLIETQGYEPARGAVQTRIGYNNGKSDEFILPHDFPAEARYLEGDF